uniref:uncharacterized protein LOC122580368 n=1 Tax=Erigeron canadensis TaxID=72917 RepID=UPI001CB9C254|nr:uncharacterized protein LOC122580368 [Erigeron canadensis]XP_043608576.1 uncharacterized protein LOC122580368 [Erigeron canadensis]
MVQKRQLVEVEYDVSPKHLKLDNGFQLVSCLEFPSKDIPFKPCSSGGVTETHFCIETCDSYRQFESGKITDHPLNTGDPILAPEHHLPKPRTLIQPENTYSCLLRCPPLKEVPIGTEYQADIPEWSGYNTKDDESLFVGSCVIPMPDLSPTLCNGDQVDKGRSDCCCGDRGSLRCVRRHILEARDNLRRNIGKERFAALGFDTMGDVVACKWTEEEEQLFHELVYSNPVSLKRNFWEHLAEAFSLRSKQEIVNYYFNVFVLQRRAEQNRFDPMNADSDDDEWQGSDDLSEEDDDLCQDDMQNYGFSVKDSIFDYKECDFQEDSCVSYEFQEPQVRDVKVVHSKPLINHDFTFDHLESKAWDGGYFSFPKSKSDFLSTGSMIEEVFGVESWKSS